MNTGYAYSSGLLGKHVAGMIILSPANRIIKTATGYLYTVYMVQVDPTCIWASVWCKRS